MRGRSALAVFGLLVMSCSDPSAVTTSTSTGLDSTTTTTEAGTTSTTHAVATTSTSQPPTFAGELPDGPCAIDDVPDEGEPTVFVGDRLYGLGADLTSPRCLLEGLGSREIEWGPLGDRVRVGDAIYGEFETLTFEDARNLEWTAPTGSRVVVVSSEGVIKVPLDGSATQNITFLVETTEIAYHPAGTHLLAIGTDSFAQDGLWFSDNAGVNFVLLAFDEGAVISDAAWSWLNEPMFVAGHPDGTWHIHRVELVDGNFEGPIVVESNQPIDMLMPSPFDPVMIGYRANGLHGIGCVDGATTKVRGVDLPEPLAIYTSTPVGWLSGERLLVLAYPDGCESDADLWVFSAGFCPGSTYGAELWITGIDGAAARQAVPTAPPAPDFTGIIEPAPA